MLMTKSTKERKQTEGERTSHRHLNLRVIYTGDVICYDKRRWDVDVVIKKIKHKFNSMNHQNMKLQFSNSA